MRGGLERWKRGVDSRSVRTALAYALNGECDSSPRLLTGAEEIAAYSGAEDGGIIRFVAEGDDLCSGVLTREQLLWWVDGVDPLSGGRRGRVLSSPVADLLLDATLNAPKSFSLVALLHPELAIEFEALQDRLRHRVIRFWRSELNARRGAGGRTREAIHRLEVVELRHRRSRALDPHAHRHLWLSVKVQGVDGKWSNVDSRVAMRLHTLVNAEGDLAARTDPDWIAALARHGYSLNEEGEVAEFAHAVRPLSRRSNQIEANRTALITQWRKEHPHLEPSHDDLRHIDRVAWATGRPRKGAPVDEDDWEGRVRRELADVDPALLVHREPAPAASVTQVDAAFLAACAVRDADDRSVGNNGRFSLVDIRAGATRAVAAAGVVAARSALQPLIDEVVHRSLSLVADLLGVELGRPQHVKGYMAKDTVRLKRELDALFDKLTAPGRPLKTEHVRGVAARIGVVFMDREQEDAAAAIAGTDRLVTVTGPAGAGKTTLLRVVKRALDRQRRHLIVVAPTKKAATVAEREVGARASSLHALLADHGWRWGIDLTGTEQWRRLALGDTDANGSIYAGPRKHPLHPGDRIVVDEAGMVDLHTARALAILATQTGAGIAMIGDPLQAAPVGHSGAMGVMRRASTAIAELTAVHRFTDPAYAGVTVRLRDVRTREDALRIAAELIMKGHVAEAIDLNDALWKMVDAYLHAREQGDSIALVTATNDEADAINRAIQQRLVAEGTLHELRVAAGRDGQQILEGDIVQTRRNDATADVQNRAHWVVSRITEHQVHLVATHDHRERRVVRAAYAVDHLQLAYASTVHGVQGETTVRSLVGPGVDAAGLYVGMTRGADYNAAIVIPSRGGTVIGTLAATIIRGIPELTIDEARAAAQIELRRAGEFALPPAHLGARVGIG